MKRKVVGEVNFFAAVKDLEYLQKHAKGKQQVSTAMDLERFYDALVVIANTYLDDFYKDPNTNNMPQILIDQFRYLFKVYTNCFKHVEYPITIIAENDPLVQVSEFQRSFITFNTSERVLRLRLQLDVLYETLYKMQEHLSKRFHQDFDVVEFDEELFGDTIID